MPTNHSHSRSQNHTGKLGFELPDTEEQLFQINNLPILDTEIVKEIYHDSWEEVLTLALNEFLDSIPSERKLMEAAHQDHDWQQVEFLVHKLKGGCLCVGMQKLAIACQYLERYIKAGHIDQIEKLYVQMINALDDTLPEVQTWFKNHH